MLHSLWLTVNGNTHRDFERGGSPKSHIDLPSRRAIEVIPLRMPALTLAVSHRLVLETALWRSRTALRAGSFVVRMRQGYDHFS